MLELAKKIATEAHSGQLDKGGHEYILHPIAVSEMVDTEESKIVALLHDVVEDTNTSLSYLKGLGFSDQAIYAIDCITKRANEKYEDYINRIKQSDLAVKVKIADMTHNSDISRILNPTKKDFERVEKYISTIKKLKS